MYYPRIVLDTDINMSKIFRGGSENWRIHLDAAATFVPALLAATTQRSTSPYYESGKQDGSILHFEDDTVIRFLLGSFISIDIISCASTRSSPFLELDHKFVLARIDLENLTGCRNWAMMLIFEISLLDKWKKETEKVHKLSIMELVKRGRQIEERLRDRLVGIENEDLAKNFSENNATNYTEITKIFGLAAMTYLYVVIFGAYPELPEIIESVSKTIFAFQNLTDTKRLRNLVWPFCISGCCLALDSQYTIFRDLLSLAGITQSTVGACLEAFKIIEACWEARKTCSCNYDWVSAMNKRGHLVLLS